MEKRINIFWFRRDLRLDDNRGFYEALNTAQSVLPIFIFDSKILDSLPSNDPRVSFIFKTLQGMRCVLETNYDSGIAFYYGKPLSIFKNLTQDYKIHTVFTNHDYEPYAKDRDLEVQTYLSKKNIAFKTYKDQVIFEKDEVVKKDGEPYRVYTPYMKMWKEKYLTDNIEDFNTKPLFNNLFKSSKLPNLSLSNIGFVASKQCILDYKVTSDLIKNYEKTRNFPSKDSTSKLGPHLRFGTVSIRKITKEASEANNEIFWQELIWREFFTQILWHYPYIQHNSFKPQYDRIEWRNNEEEFKAWCEGLTGYPLVDAGMRQLNKTGFMHNRVRMVVGSFLCKHLLIDWRWGESYFAEKLHDYDMASNVGNWQWVAGCGVDAAPYFRIFNPTTQIQKFDKDHNYINRWVTDLQELTYPTPIVEHKFARERCLQVYKEALK